MPEAGIAWVASAISNVALFWGSPAPLLLIITRIFFNLPQLLLVHEGTSGYLYDTRLG